MAEVTSRIVADNALKPSAKLIYLYLAAAYRQYYSNPMEHGSYIELGSDTGFSESTVRKAIKRLESVGLIKADSGFNKYESWLKIDILHMDNGYSVLRQLATAGDP